MGKSSAQQENALPRITACGAASSLQRDGPIADDAIACTQRHSQAAPAVWGRVVRSLALVVAGTHLFAAAEATAQPFAYVATAYSDTITIIDAATNTVAKVIASHGYPLAVAASHDGRSVFVANVDDSTISVLDTASNEITRTITLPVHTYPQDLAVSADGSRVYAISQGLRTPRIAGSLFIIDTASGSVQRTLALPDDFPVAIRTTPGSAFAYIVNLDSDSVSVVDTVTNSLVGKIPVGGVPIALALTPDGTLAYAANMLSSTVSVIDTASRSVTATVPVGSGPHSIAVAPDGSLVYVANQYSNSVYVIDAESRTLRDAVFPVRAQQPRAPVTEPYGVTITPDGSTLYVTNETSYSVSSIDTATDTVTAVIAVTGSPRGIAIPPLAGPSPTRRPATATPVPTTTPGPAPPISRRLRLYAAIASARAIAVINAASNNVVATIPIAAGEPNGIAFTPDGAFAYVSTSGGTIAVINAAANSFVTSIDLGAVTYTAAMSPTDASLYVGSNGRVFVIDTASNTIKATIFGGNINSAIAFTPDGTSAYVADSGGGGLMVIDTRSKAVTTTIPVYNPQAIAISPDGKFAYVTAGNLFVIDTASNAVVAEVPAGAGPGAIALSPDGSIGYVGCGNNSLFVLDTTSKKILHTIYPVPSAVGMILLPGGAFAYVASVFSDSISVVDLRARTAVASISVGGWPGAIALASPPLTFCVGDCADERVVTVDEVLRGVRIALAEEPIEGCPELDADGDGQVTVDELLQAVNNALSGCPSPPATAIPTPTPTKTPAPGECAYVCDSRPCNAVCPDGSPHFGYCELTGSDGCQCTPFECPYACVAIDPVTSPWDQLMQTVRGHTVGPDFGANIRITGGAQFVSGFVTYSFAIDVPLNP
jgi:YVTN family beta-propeller protein